MEQTQTTPHTDPADSLKARITTELVEMGFAWDDDTVIAPTLNEKADIRNLYVSSRRKLATERVEWLEDLEQKALKFFAVGKEVVPEAIRPSLRLVQSQEDADLFKYASLLWSVPVSPGYGRRMRFLVVDNSNGKLIGILGLCDPVYCLAVRDDWIGWSDAQKRQRLWHILDAYVLGAVPPYNALLCGKLVAMLATTDVVRNAFRRKYRDTVSGILGISRKPHLVMVTTASAMGRSSMLNRLKWNGEHVWQPIGMTQGWGHFHLGNGLFGDISEFMRDRQPDVFKSYRFGKGPNWKFRVIRSCLQELGLPSDLLRHGIQREVFAAPLATQWKEFLTGDANRPHFIHRSIGDVADYFNERWLLARVRWDERYKLVNWDDIKSQARGL